MCHCAHKRSEVRQTEFLKSVTEIMRMCDIYVDDVLLATYVGTVIFSICYSCIRGSFRLAPNNCNSWIKW